MHIATCAKCGITRLARRVMCEACGSTDWKDTQGNVVATIVATTSKVSDPITGIRQYFAIAETDQHLRIVGIVDNDFAIGTVVRVELTAAGVPSMSRIP